MLNKPIIPIPYSSAIDAAAAANFSCEFSSAIKNYSFYIYDISGTNIYRTGSSLTTASRNFSYQLATSGSPISNGNNYSWNVSYWNISANAETASTATVEVSTAGSYEITLSNPSCALSKETRSERIEETWYGGRLLWSISDDDTNDLMDAVRTDISTGTEYVLSCTRHKNGGTDVIGISDIIVDTSRDNTRTHWYYVQLKRSTFTTYDKFVIREKSGSVINTGDIISIGGTCHSVESVDTSAASTYTVKLSSPLMADVASGAIITRYTSGVEYNESPYYPFYTRSPATLKISDGDVTKNIHTFAIMYNQSDGAVVKTHSIKLTDSFGNTLYDSGEIYDGFVKVTGHTDQVCTFTYDGYMSGMTYKLEVECTDSYDEEHSVISTFTCGSSSEASLNKIAASYSDTYGCVIVDTTDLPGIGTTPVSREGTAMEFDESLPNYGCGHTGFVLCKINKRTNAAELVARFEGYTLPNYMYDYNICTGETYEYCLYKYTQNTYSYVANMSYTDGVLAATGDYYGHCDSGLIKSDPICINTDDWRLVDVTQSPLDDAIYSADKDSFWKLSFSVEPTTYQYNMDKHVYDGYGKYSNVSMGNKGYITSSLSFILGTADANDEYDEPKERIRKWYDFINNNKPKLLCDAFGRNYIVVITESSHESYNTLPAYTKVTFSYTEIAPANGASIGGWWT